VRSTGALEVSFEKTGNLKNWYMKLWRKSDSSEKDKYFKVYMMYKKKHYDIEKCLAARKMRGKCEP